MDRVGRRRDRRGAGDRGLGLLGGASRLIVLTGHRGGVPDAWLHVLFWGGLRGAVAIALALSLPVDFPERVLLQEITFGIILFTLLIQGTTIEWVIDRVGAGRPRDADRPARRRLAGPGQPASRSSSASRSAISRAFVVP